MSSGLPHSSAPKTVQEVVRALESRPFPSLSHVLYGASPILLLWLCWQSWQSLKNTRYLPFRFILNKSLTTSFRVRARSIVLELKWTDNVSDSGENPKNQIATLWQSLVGTLKDRRFQMRMTRKGMNFDINLSRWSEQLKCNSFFHSITQLDLCSWRIIFPLCDDKVVTVYSAIFSLKIFQI